MGEKEGERENKLNVAIINNISGSDWLQACSIRNCAYACQPKTYSLCVCVCLSFSVCVSVRLCVFVPVFLLEFY